MEVSNVCSLCGSSSEAFCDCQSGLTWLCSGCFASHWRGLPDSRHEIHQPGELATLNTDLEKRKNCRLVKTYLCERSAQIKREHREYAARLDNAEKDLHDYITNKFDVLRKELELSVKKLEQEVLVLQDQIQSYFLGQGQVKPLCEKLVSKSTMLSRFLSDPIGTVLTNTSGIEIQVANLQGIRFKSLEALAGGGLQNPSLYYFSVDIEALVIFDLEAKESTEYLLDYEDLIAYDSSWCTLDSSDVFVCGGTVNMKKLTNACILLTSSTELTSTQPMLDARSSHGLILLNGYIYCFGGEGKSGCCIAESERFHLETSTWSPIFPLPQSLTKVSTAVFKEVIYLTGYNTFKLFTYSPNIDSYRDLQFVFSQSFRSACLLVDAGKNQLMILRGPEVIICDIEENTELTVKESMCQTMQRGDVWEVKGSPAKKEYNHYVYNYFTKTVFEVLEHARVVEITEMVENNE